MKSQNLFLYYIKNFAWVPYRKSKTAKDKSTTTT